MRTIFEKRMHKLHKLVGRGVQGVLITNPENIRYLCGFTGTEGTLLLADGSSFFLTDGRYTTQASQQVQAGRIITFKNKTKELARLVKKCGLATLGYESQQMTVAQLRDLERALAGVRLIEQADAFDALRTVKDAAEIKLLARAAEIAATSLADTLACIRLGMSEREVAAELEYRMRKNGGAAAAFPTIVASGARSALPHGTASAKRLASGELLLIDYGVVYEGYCSDETCTFALGKPSVKQRRIYDTVKKAHDRALAALAPGKLLKEIDAAARGYIAARGLGRCFSHGTGHGLGLCVHEQPVVSARSKSVAQKGMVITIEPGVYLPGWGGVRIEDTAVVTAGGCKLLTCTDKSLQLIGG
jgi:Xaa-Pro aminopeptidase